MKGRKMESMTEKIFKTDGIYQLSEGDTLNLSELCTEFFEKVEEFGCSWYGTLLLVIGGATVIEINGFENAAPHLEQLENAHNFQIKGQILVGWGGAFGYEYSDLLEVIQTSIDLSIPKSLDRNTPIATTAFGTWRVTGAGILYASAVPREHKLFA